MNVHWKPIMASLFLCLFACGKPDTDTDTDTGIETRGECMANVDPNEAVYTCSGEELWWCVCDNYVDNRCPDQAGQWVVQDIDCTCDEWLVGECPVD